MGKNHIYLKRNHFNIFCIFRDPDVHPQPETYWGNVNPIGPRACYDEGKRVSETLSYAYAKQENVNVRVARIFNTYGPRMHMNDGRVVSNFILQALQNESITVSDFFLFLITKYVNKVLLMF